MFKESLSSLTFRPRLFFMISRALLRIEGLGLRTAPAGILDSTRNSSRRDDEKFNLPHLQMMPLGRSAVKGLRSARERTQWRIVSNRMGQGFEKFATTP